MKLSLIKMAGLIFLFKMLLISSFSYAAPIVLNVTGHVVTQDVVNVDGVWTYNIFSLDPDSPLDKVGEGERSWEITGEIIINNEVLHPEFSSNGRAGAFKVLSYNISFGDIFRLSNESPIENFWVSPDVSLRLGGYDFGGGHGQRLDSGSFMQSYRIGHNINDIDNIKVDLGNGFHAAMFSSFMKIESWSSVIEVSEPSDISLLLLCVLAVFIGHKRKMAK